MKREGGRIVTGSQPPLESSSPPFNVLTFLSFFLPTFITGTSTLATVFNLIFLPRPKCDWNTIKLLFCGEKSWRDGRQSFHVGHRFLATTTRRRIWKEKNRRRPCSATRSDWDEVIGHVLLRDPNNVLTWKTNDAGLYHYLQHTHTHKQWEILPQKREERIYDVAGSSCHLSVCWGRARVQLSRVLILSTEPIGL